MPKPPPRRQSPEEKLKQARDIFEEGGDLLEAEEAARCALLGNPRLVAARVLLAEIAFAERDVEAAEEELSLALSLDPSCFPARYLLARSALEGCELAEAHRLGLLALEVASTPYEESDVRALLKEVMESEEERKRMEQERERKKRAGG